MTDTMTEPAADERAALEQRLIEASAVAMTPAVWAKVKPDAISIYDSHGTHTFAKINANANRIARFLRAQGLEPGDPVALLCSNRAEFVEVLQGSLRAGLRLTPVNWHLTADEIAYVVNDCQAKVLFAETRYEGGLRASADAPRLVAKVAIGGQADGFQNYHDVLAAYDGADIDDPVMGNTMLYTSGTTGRPKGVYRKALNQIPFVLGGARGYRHESDVQLCVGPAYHAAPLGIDVRVPMSQGVPVVFMDGRWDSEAVLAHHRETPRHPRPHGGDHVPAAALAAAGGAGEIRPLEPQADHPWRRALSARREAGDDRVVGPDPQRILRRLRRRRRLHHQLRGVAEEAGQRRQDPVAGLRPACSTMRAAEVDPGQPGMLYFKVAAANPFEYFNDPAKTAASHRDGYFTLGDVGYFDEDGYLFLTGRTAECIISGGVNIYPQEIDNELIKHPAVEDSCAIGVPNAEWGEEVKVVLMLKPGFEPSEALTAEIMAFARERLAGFKIPRSVDYVDDLPRSPAGKIQRGKVRAPFWAGRKVQI